MDFKHFSISDVGRVRQANEDFCGDKMTVNGHVVVVCDGMGGHVGGATASKIAVNSIIEFFEKEPADNIYVGISKAFQFANEQVYGNAITQPELKGMGTTGTVLVIRDEGCYIGHVGDSRIYIKSDGKLHRLTKDHSFVQGLVDQGIISDDDAESHPKKNQILKALGIAPEVEATICATPIQPKSGDTFLLCSDGLNGMVKDPVIEGFVDPDSVQLSAQNLINAANLAGGTDNITASLVCIKESSFTSSSFKSFNPVVEPTNAETVILERDDRVSPKKVNLKWIIAGAAGLVAIIVLVFIFIPSSELTEDSDKDTSNEIKNDENLKIDIETPIKEEKREEPKNTNGESEGESSDLGEVENDSEKSAEEKKTYEARVEGLEKDGYKKGEAKEGQENRKVLGLNGYEYWCRDTIKGE